SMPLSPCLIIPTAFSPNNDGKNDFFRITSQSINAVNVFQVFNRWGNVIWEGATPDAAWDGTYKNELQEMGAYPYYIEAVCQGSDNVEIAKGYILLIR
ncbi:MAG: gliding motility-associated C-terminal domain-containing protein, partial [Chitinophagales bacterium]